MQGLPSESLFRTAQRDAYTDEQLAEFAAKNEAGPHGVWSHTDLLLAAVFDGIQQLTHVLMCVNAENPSAITAPSPLRRPGVMPPRRVLSPGAQKYLARIRQQHEIDRAKGV